MELNKDQELIYARSTPLAPPKTVRAVKSSRRRNLKSTNDTKPPSTRKLSTRKSSTMKPACKSRSRKRLSKSKFEKATTTQLFLEPEFSTDELPLNDTSYAMEAFWGTGSPLNDNSKYTSSSQPASDPSDISKDFPNEDLMTLFPSMERGDYGPP